MRERRRGGTEGGGEESKGEGVKREKERDFHAVTDLGFASQFHLTINR